MKIISSISKKVLPVVLSLIPLVTILGPVTSLNFVQEQDIDGRWWSDEEISSTEIMD